jgi:hypothetical protein
VVEQPLTKLAEKIIEPLEIDTIWCGGDPIFKNPKRGGNISDVLQVEVYLCRNYEVPRLPETHSERYCNPTRGLVPHLPVFTYHRLAKVPQFMKIQIGYKSEIASIKGKDTFGGFQIEAPLHLDQFLQIFRLKCLNSDLLPPPKVYPVAATAAYFTFFPCMAKRLVVIVIPRAGYITLQEVLYLQLLLKVNNSFICS